ncbi:sodium/proline symporter [Flavobacteriaceae bacterium]|jgi:sodium/proline symporter|nr:sodium/proline symporter [Flavobacteriaceae bacterium]MDB9760098.1 sodium/proline symporter [bacterium]MDB4025712.1 sodium/proline symporter [Flavobacteriaceae bacterium]MDB4064859.1 sodium/proline symporter [Flavobacteriaceae bacterium]MDB4236705.1 sodium/proline symporter [Flavobacteriaceae bacterium]|tara:strand:- start:45 stop:1541 length:1497 start_codon:yes stop_codon:yes gene_type:complete
MITKIIVLAIYVSILFLIGIFASRRINSMSDYYLGGKKMGFWAVAFSARATGESGWLLIGLTGMGAMAGYSAYWVVLGELLGVFLSWQFMAKRFKTRSDTYKSITIPDYLQSHFKSSTNTLRIISAATLVVFVVIYVASQMDVTGIAFESMLNIDYRIGALIGFVIVLIYIFIGGFVAAVWSDMFQGILMFFGLVLLPIVVWFSMDHGAGISEGLNAIDPTLTQIMGRSDDGLMNLFTILGFSMIGLGFLGSPQVYVRFMSIKSEKEIDKGKWIALIFTLLTDAAAVTIGILARIYFTSEGQDPEVVLGNGGENVLSMITNEFLPSILVAIFIAIVLSAIMSTIDSLLVLASSAITRDFYQKIFRPDLKDEDLTSFSRLVTVIMAVIALCIAILLYNLYPERKIFWIMIFGWSGIAATFCPVIILSLFWKGYSEKGAIASMITGFVSVIFFKFVVSNMEGIGAYFIELDVLAPSFLLAMIVGYIVSKIAPPKHIEKST